MTWATAVPAGLLLLAGALRAGDRSPARRCVATALLAAAAATVLGNPACDRVLGMLPHAGDAIPLVRFLLFTLAGTAVFTLARRVSPAGALWQWPLVPLGMLVALAEVVMFTAAAADRLDPALPVAAQWELPEVIALWMTALVWPALASLFLIPALRAYGPAVPRREIRIGIGLVCAGLVLLGVAGAGTAAQVASGGSPVLSTNAPAAVIDLLGATGLTAIAAGFLAPRLADLLQPLAQWLRHSIAVRRLAPLVSALGAVAPEWILPDRGEVSTLRRPSLLLYRQVILIRDASWTLLGGVDADVIGRAVDFAQRHAPQRHEDHVAALAEACWISFAIDQPRTDPSDIDATGEFEILERGVDEPAGSLAEEAAFLVAVAQAWRHRKLMNEFRRELTPQARSLPSVEPVDRSARRSL